MIDESLGLTSILDFPIPIKKNYVEHHELLDLDRYDLARLIISIRDDIYKMDLLKNFDKFDFNFHQIISIIDSIEDDDYKKEIIQNYKEYHLKQIDLVLILESMSDDSIKDVVDNNKNYDLTGEDISSAVSIINDDLYKKDIVKDYDNYGLNNDDLATLISSISDEGFKKQLIFVKNQYNLEHNQIARILCSINDDSYKFNILTNYKRYELSSDDIALILNSFSDLNNYLFDVLENYKKYNFDNDILSSVIVLTFDDKEKEKIVVGNSYSFSPALLGKIALSINDLDLKSKVINQLYSNGVFGNSTVIEKIKLPKEIGFGIEIETEGKYSELVTDEILPSGWQGVIDATLDHGIEAVSPILHSGNEDEIDKVCAFLTSFGQVVNSNCAAHVHIGCAYFNNDIHCFKNLLELCSNCERILYLISNEEGTIPRNRIFKYASPISNKIFMAINDGVIKFDFIEDVSTFSKNINSIQKTKFSSVNFRNIGVYDKDTIEFRTANGTINPNVWIDNINLFGSIVYIAKYISLLQAKEFKELSDSEKISLYFYEKIKDPIITDRQRLVALLNLFPDGINKKIYLNRYDVNSDLTQDLEVNNILTAISLLKPIKISTCSNELKEKVDNNYRKQHIIINNNKIR